MNAHTKAEFEKLLGQKGNNTCIDCNGYNPQWASVSNGVFMCIKCAGMHRSLGVHITFVRSVTMDSWSPLQMERMKEGGNDKCRKFWREQKFPKNASGRELWDNEAQEKYRQRLLALAKRENPPPIPFIGYKPKKYPAKNTHMQAADSLGSLSSSTLVQDHHKNNPPHSKSSSNLKMQGMGGGEASRSQSSMQGFGNYNPDDGDDDPFGDVFGGISSWATSVAKQAQEVSTVVAAKSKEAASAVGERAKTTTASLQQKFQDEQLKEQVTQSASQTWMSVSTTVGSWWSSASQQVTQMYEETVGPAENGDVALYNPDSGLHPSSGKYAASHMDSDSYFGRQPPPQQQQSSNGDMIRIEKRKGVKYASFGSDAMPQQPSANEGDVIKIEKRKGIKYASYGSDAPAQPAAADDDSDDTMDILGTEPDPKRNNNHTSLAKKQQQTSPQQDSFDDWGFDDSPKLSSKKEEPPLEEGDESSSPQLEGVIAPESNPVALPTQSADDLLGNLDLDDMDLGDLPAQSSESKPPTDSNNAAAGADDWGWDE